MPLEGHFQRVNTPLRRLTSRERNVAIAVLAVTLLALAAVILATAGDSRSETVPPGCIHEVVAGRTGGEVVAGCGAEARAICAQSAQFNDPRAEKIVASCNEAGVPTTGKPGGPFSVTRLP